MKFVKGLFKSPLDLRDYVVTNLLKTVELPESYDITDKMTSVRSQGNEGSCVGFATAVGVKEYQEKIDYSKVIRLSPRYVYEYAKKISGHTEGTTLKAAMQVIQERGVCEEKLWPYIPKDVGTQAPIADSNAARYKVKAYARVTNLSELKTAIIDFGATLIGVKVYKGMVSEECGKTGIVPNPSCWDSMNVLGGHAICAVAYNDKSPYFKDGHIKIKNSWGDFGDNGYLYLSYKYIKSNMLDAFSCIDINDPEPYRVANLPDKDKRWV